MESKLCSPSVFRGDKKLVVEKYQGSSKYRFLPFKLEDVVVSVSEAMNCEGPDTIRLEYPGSSFNDPEEVVKYNMVFDVHRRPRDTSGFNVTLKQGRINTVMSAIEKENLLIIRGPNFELTLKAVDSFDLTSLPLCKKAQDFITKQAASYNSALEIICRGMHLIAPEAALQSIRDLSNGTWCMRFGNDFDFDIRTERSVCFNNSEEPDETPSLIVRVTSPKSGFIEGKLEEVLSKLSAEIRSK